jgi:TonB-dependent starch-binding outer membrane protein SusC
MKEIAWLNDLKIRGGWGKTGNQETRDYAFLSVVNYNPKYALGTGALPGDGTINAAAVLGDFPIKDMSWETVTSTSLGVDAILFDNKLALNS